MIPLNVSNWSADELKVYEVKNCPKLSQRPLYQLTKSPARGFNKLIEWTRAKKNLSRKLCELDRMGGCVLWTENCNFPCTLSTPSIRSSKLSFFTKDSSLTIVVAHLEATLLFAFYSPHSHLCLWYNYKNFNIHIISVFRKTIWKLDLLFSNAFIYWKEYVLKKIC